MATPRESAVLSLAAIRAPRNRPAEYLFNERQSIFVLAESVARDRSVPRILRDAHGKRRPVKVSIDTRRGLIWRASEPSRAELDAFERRPPPLDKTERPRRIDLARIDPSIFNFVDIHQKWPAFKLCKKIVPSYAKAKEIFDFCAQLSCSLPGPYAVAPCISFQYVRDGCYARAHQMRRIITTRFGYCCEKVFSFADQDPDVLSVKADKWGGCCVTWWYHVAPLLRMNLKLPFVRKPLVLAMVIDPGMFDKPVLLSTWLSAQENTACHANARVSSYSIQPGSAYWPVGGYPVTSYGTDPGYTQTQSTLIAYSPFTTCP